MATLAASAALGLANPVKAQTANSVEPDAESVNQLESPEFLEDSGSQLGAESSSTAADAVASAASSETSGIESDPADLETTDAASEALETIDPAEAVVQPLAQSTVQETPPEAAPGPDEESDTLEFDFQAPPNTQIDLQEEINQSETAPQTPAGQTPPETASPDQAAPTTNPPSTSPTAPPATTTQPEPRVLVSEVVVEGAEGDLLDQVYNAIQTRPGRTTTRSQLQEDINAVFATGFFSNVRAIPEDTPLGVRVTFAVQPNPPLQAVRLEGSVLTQPQEDGSFTLLEYEGEQIPLQEAVDRIFSAQYGETANLQALQLGIERLNQLYQDNGYVLAQVIAAPAIDPDGTARLEVAEGVIESINIRFLNRDGQAVDEEGNPIRGRTRPFIITREFESQPGNVFNQNQIQRDLQRTFGLGIFEDLNISLNPGQDPRQVDVTVNVTERRTGSLAASVGVSSSSGLFGAVSLQEQNLGGNNQRVNAEIQVGQRDVLFDLSFTDPWIGNDPNRTSYTVNAFGRESISLIFDGGEREVTLPNGDRPRVRRFGGGISFSRPLDDGWRASLGLQYQNVSIRDADGTISPRDEFGNLLSYNDSGIDNLATLQFSASQDRRNDPAQTTSGYVLRASTEQALGLDSIFYNRLRGSFSYFIPVRLLSFTRGCQQDDPSPADCPQTIAFNVQGGTFLGDFPPYEAFALGGTDSVRGYGAGELGSGQSYLQATAEYRFPVFSIISGALFFDAGTDLGTASEVQGDPAGIREKPGSGFGYGVGIRVRSPLGLIRVDYAINNEGDSQFYFGIGERF